MANPRKCRAALWGGALTGGFTGLFAVLGLFAAFWTPLASAKTVVWVWSGVVGSVFASASALAGGLTGAAARDCCDPPPPPRKRRARRVLIVCSFGAGVIGALMVWYCVLASYGSASVMADSAVAGAGTLIQLVVFLPMAYRGFMRSLGIAGGIAALA